MTTTPETQQNQEALAKLPPQAYFDEQEAMAKLLPIADKLVALVQAAPAPQCLYQIQEPPTKTEALAHYSQQAILAMGEAGAAQRVAADVPASGTVALTEYLKDCDQHSIVPDVGGAFASAFAAGFNLATPSAVPAAVAVTALEKVLHAIQHYLPPDGVSARDTLTTIFEVVDPWPLSAKAATGAEPLPLLVRDVARELGITCSDACIALKPLGNFSVNSAVTAEMASKLRECFPEAAPVSVGKAGFQVIESVAQAIYEQWNGHEGYVPWQAGGNSHKQEDARGIARSALAATPEAAAPANCDSLEQLSENKGLAQVVLPEPAEFQLRTKPEWDAKAMWTDWEKCKPESAADYERVPVLHNWMYEVRKLYTEQQLRASLLAGVSAPAAQAVVMPDFDLHTSQGGRGLVAWYFANVLGRHDFAKYISTTLAADFACALAQALRTPQAQADARDAEITWPKARNVGRIGDMSPSAHMRVGFDSDNDVFVSVWDERGGGSIEFCNPGGGGGGQSSRTRMALIALMVAMEADNAEKPSRDWWAQRAAQAAQQGGDKQ